MSKAYLDKLRDIQMKPLSERGWFSTALLWVIDSKFRTMKYVDNFLQEQIDNPSKEIVDMAQALRLNNPYKTVAYIENWVYGHLTYVTDLKAQGMSEKWSTALETFKSRKDDCEGQNGLIYVLCRLAGIPASNLYCCVGDTSGGYHFWVIFFDSERNRFVKLDTTIYPEIKDHIKDKETFKFGTTYKKIDYLFNETGVWGLK